MGGPGASQSPWLGHLGRRLAVGSAAIVLVSIVLLAVVTLLLADSDITSAGHESEATSTAAIVSAVKATYRADEDWRPVDLGTIKDLTRATGLGLVLRSGHRVLLEVPSPRPGGTSQSTRVVVGRRTIATAVFALPLAGLLPEEVAFRRSVEKAVAIASGLALVVGFGTALFASRRLVAPVQSLIVATRRLGSGDRSSRVGALRTAGELGELGRAFDYMAGALEREDGLRRALVADLAHELRTPLAVLRAELEGLATGLVDLDQHTVASMSDEVGHLSSLVEDLRVLAAAEAAVLSLRKERVDLAQVASNVAVRLTPLFLERDIHLELELAVAEVSGDRDRLEQVVVNLLSNAAKFTPAGGRVAITVDATESHAYLQVRDTGCGISPEDQKLVFQRFFRAGTSRDVPGTGIGLAVVAALVAAHGGTVEIRSSPGSGSTFTVHLPTA